jgi:pimeloyl-ACP methyl ester carboxylesterase
MYQLHAFATPNSIKPVIALEELGLGYTIHAVNVRKGEQKSSRFVEFNPNAKVPVLTVTDGGGLADRYRVIAPDLPGFGFTVVPRGTQLRVHVRQPGRDHGGFR